MAGGREPAPQLHSDGSHRHLVERFKSKRKRSLEKKRSVENGALFGFFFGGGRGFPPFLIGRSDHSSLVSTGRRVRLVRRRGTFLIGRVEELVAMATRRPPNPKKNKTRGRAFYYRPPATDLLTSHTPVTGKKIINQ